MKKNLLTMLLSLSFLFVGVSFVKAETQLSQSDIAKVTKKISTLKIACSAKNMHCESQLVDLVRVNDHYMSACFAGGIYLSTQYCGSLANNLLAAAARYEICEALTAKNIDMTIDRQRFRKESNSNS
jgi:hypothetical protein